MSNRVPAFFKRSVTFSSSLLGCLLPLGWLCTTANCVADASTKMRIINRTSTAVRLMPPTETRTFFITFAV